MTLRIGSRAPVRLTPLEARLLQLLTAAGGEPVRSERILGHVWGSRAGGDRQLLKQLVHRLRRKLEPGIGYRLDA